VVFNAGLLMRIAASDGSTIAHLSSGEFCSIPTNVAKAASFSPALATDRLHIVSIWDDPQSPGTAATAVHLRRADRERHAKRLELQSLQELIGSYRWSVQLNRTATTFVSSLNRAASEKGFGAAVRTQAGRRRIATILTRMREYLLRNPPRIINAESADRGVSHTMSDASGELLEVQQWLKCNPGSAPPPDMWKRANIVIGGWFRRPSADGAPFAWRLRIPLPPDWVATSAPVTIAVFELLAIVVNLATMIEQGETVTANVLVSHCDNISDAYALAKSSTSSPILMALAIVLYDTASENGVDLYPSWLRGDHNIAADAASRIDKVDFIRRYDARTSFIEFPVSRAERFWQHAKSVLDTIAAIQVGGNSFNAARAAASAVARNSSGKC
jgi:hypothetical protein